MGALTEPEIFDCLVTNFKLAAEHADDLASLPAKGPTYDKFRQELRLIEGACRQASAWREDTRWLPIGRMMAEVHQKAGGWLRGVKRAGVLIRLAEGERQPLFRMLAENLRALAVVAEQLRSKATGHVGAILPTQLAGPHRDTVPVGWTPSVGGLLLPSAA